MGAYHLSIHHACTRWHTAINLEPTIALTQNDVPASSARHVLRYLDPATARDLVSGVAPERRAELRDHFLDVMRRGCPELDLETELAAAAAPAEAAAPASAPPPTWWDKLTSEAPPTEQSDAADQAPTAAGRSGGDAEGGGFSFGFG